MGTFVSARACFEQQREAVNGSFTASDTRDSCKASDARQQLCGIYDQCVAPPAKHGDPQLGAPLASDHTPLLWRGRRRRAKLSS